MLRTSGSFRILSLSATLVALTFTVSKAQAQATETPPPSPAEEADEGPGEAAVAEDPSTEADPAEPAEPATPPEAAPAQAQVPENAVELEARIQELEGRVAALHQAREEAEVAALMKDEEAEVAPELLRIYGFMDMGIQRLFGSDTYEASFNGNALTFVVGNINTYIDMNPHPDWRGLVELRFTNAPHGYVNQIGSTAPGFESTFNRTNTQQFDPHATAANTPMWGGYTVIERAWIEWKRFQQLQVRVGNWFSPFGVWNVDHGQPTLIAATTPQFIQQMLIPLRQTGIQLLGSFFIKDWEIAYRAWVSNGRNEIAVQDLWDNKAFGVRSFIRKDAGKVAVQVGGTYHHGPVADKVISISSIFPQVEYDFSSTYAYTEDVFGADLSLDIHDFRFRAEGTSQLRRFEEGARTPPGGFSGDADGWRMSLYGVAAYQLPFWGLEPFVAAEVMKVPNPLQQTDGLVELAPGLNVHFNPAITWKTQATRTWFFKYGGDGDNANGNILSVVSRLVLAY